MDLDLQSQPKTRRPTTRERLLRAAYELFSERGIHQVGIDEVLTRSQCAKASLYDHFGSKADLALAFLDRREQVWTREWLEAEITRLAHKPEDRLLAIFDVFDGWFNQPDFEGCSFINVLLETRPDDPVNAAAIEHLATIRAIVRGLAREAGFKHPHRFAQTWHMLMKGSIVTAGEGHRAAARDAKRAARLILDGWPRR